MFRTFVQAGRLAFINFGEDYGKPVLIVDWADAKRMLIEGREVPRMMYPLRRLQLTRRVIKLNRGARSGAVQKVWKAEKVDEKFNALPVAMKKARREQRANLDDFSRFSVMINRKQRAFAVRKAVAKQINPKKGGKKDAKAPAKKGKK